VRLEKIKLTGFKSFVEPTTVALPSNLVGIVGPNGCGKSNIIDAIRWVLGESSAKMLRGAAMADVIFNGSTNRQPVKTASIELQFDNRDGRAQGPYASFSDISVKRQVSRDGQSLYFLNGTRCRRRDIHDLFLGTGLGSRSYAIIEQGTISRFIEARPEELRLFIEEAASISKYKERRKETEQRLQQTQENLDRLTDIQQEIAKQLKRLERQASAAQRYQTLTAEKQQLEMALAAYRWHQFHQQLQADDQSLAQLERIVQEQNEQQAQLETAVQQGHTAHHQATAHLSELQAQCYHLQGEMTRLQQAQQFSKQQRSRLETELKHVQQDRAHIDQANAHDQQHLEQVKQDLEHKQHELTQATQALIAATTKKEQLRQQLAACQARFETVQARNIEPLQKIELARTQINNFEQRLAQDEQRYCQISSELAQLDIRFYNTQVEQLQADRAATETQLHDSANTQAHILEQLRQLETEQHDIATTLSQQRDELTTLQIRQAHLQALQAAAIGTDNETITHWLEGHALTECPRLFEHLTVDDDWQFAVEIALDDALTALGISHHQINAWLDSDQNPGLTAITLNSDPISATHTFINQPSLLTVVNTDWPIVSLLSLFYLADDLNSAYQHRSQLAAHERFITRQGIIVARDWIRAPAATPTTLTGSLNRAEELKTVIDTATRLQTDIATLEQQQGALETKRHQLEQAREQALDAVRRLSQDKANHDAELAALQARLQHAQERSHHLHAEQQQLTDTCTGYREQIDEAQALIQALTITTTQLQEEHEQLTHTRETVQHAVQDAAQVEQQCQQQVQQLQIDIETHRATQTALQDNLARVQEQKQLLIARQRDLEQELTADQQPQHDLVETLADISERYEVANEQLVQAGNHVNACLQHVEDLEQQRQQVQQSIQHQQQQLDDKRLARHEQLIHCRHLEEQFATWQQQPETVLASLAETADIDSLTEQLASVTAALQRLGHVNLAALEECQDHANRLRDLQAQRQDVEDAVATLEAAMNSIDRETRTRFKETFDRINQGLQTLFPQLFGGGHAYLELTERNLLEAGVTIMARPPGKRNASIHLLSGGEKALTAIAMVFAIFQLNPAPFCLLDEVDAPLDDVNVGRFCDLLRTMSDQIQFIFISHNKMTMEIADHLIGVTMCEPGVSRLVTVDIAEAMRFAAS
jgi:chromosome segregation protein